MVKNSSAQVWFGMHMCAGVAQYNPSESDPQRIFVNEDTVKTMDSTFKGKPVYVEHVESVPKKVDDVRKEADGWVIRSFFNTNDGKHWVEFITVTEKAENAIRNGYRLSNAYVPRLSGRGGEWNAVPFQNEVVGGEYEHLAIVKDPRYEESVVLTPEQFKQYNETKQLELKKISNKKEESKSMFNKLKFWNRKPVESLDYENLSVTLPKSGKEYSILKLINMAEEREEMEHDRESVKETEKGVPDGHPAMHDEHEKLKQAHKKLMDEHEKLKRKHEHAMKNREMDSEVDLELEAYPVDVEGDLHNEDEEESAVLEEHRMEKKGGPKDSQGEERREHGSGHAYKDRHHLKNKDEEGEIYEREKVGHIGEPRKNGVKKNDPYDTEADKKEDVETLAAERQKKMQNMKKQKHFDTLRNAHLNVPQESNVDFNKLSRGKARYGSGN